MRLTLIVIISVLIIGFVAGGYYALAKGVPPLDELKRPHPVNGTKVYADDETLIGEFKVDKGIFVPLAKIPASLKNAVIAVEDARFWQHKGLDYIGIVRALVTDVIHGSVKQGGSTITQQLAKILFLSPEKTVKRKLREAYLAIKIEKELSKNEILELYLNRTYFGHGAYGIEMASKVYFGKSVTQLNLAEAALLAGLVKAPNIYSPYNNLVRSRERQEIVLSRMEEVGFITEQEKQKALNQPMHLASLRIATEAYTYFLEYIRHQLDQQYGEELVYTGGLRVYTTLDRHAQVVAHRAMQDGLREVDKRRGWRGPIGQKKDIKEESLERERGAFSATAGDISTGIVLAVTPKEATVKARGITGKLSISEAQWASTVLKAGAKPQSLKNFKLSDIVSRGDIVWVRFKTISAKQVTLSLEQEPEVEGALVAIEPETGFIRTMVGGFSATRGEFNRAVQAKRQPGSAFKPIIYAAALEHGFTPATVINDEPVTYPGGPNGDWQPENYDRKFHGPTRLREALAYSRNVVTVKLTEMTGIDRVISFAKGVGVDSNMPRELSIALGSMSVTPLDMASAFAVFANHGTRMAPLSIKYITDSKGALLSTKEPEGKEVVSPQTSFLITSMMEDVIAQGTGQRAKIGRPAAGKTGTSSDYKDAWFVGYTPDLVACVWVGFDDMRRSLGHGEVGGRAAAPIWANFMKNALAEHAPSDFTRPEGIVQVSIDPYSGLLAQDEAAGMPEYFKQGTQPRDFTRTQQKYERPTPPADLD